MQIKIIKIKNQDAFFDKEKNISGTRRDRAIVAQNDYRLIKPQIIEFKNKKIKNGTYALKKLGICVAVTGQMPQYYIANLSRDGIVDIEKSYRTSTIL